MFSVRHTFAITPAKVTGFLFVSFPDSPYMIYLNHDDNTQVKEILMIHIDQYPQLKLLCWNLDHNIPLEGSDALALYERNWWMVDQEALESHERQLIDRLVNEFGNGVFLA